MKHEDLDRRVRFLTRYSTVLTLITSGLIVTAMSDEPAIPKVLDVERINVRSADGTLAVVISNEERFPGNIINDIEYNKPRAAQGLLFYNSEGDEAGGLIFHTERGEDGVVASGSLTFDRFEGDQVVQVRYVEGPDYYETGLKVTDQVLSGLVGFSERMHAIEQLPEEERPAAFREMRKWISEEGLWEVPRVFVGTQSEDAVIALRDGDGRVRARLRAEGAGTSYLEFLDEEGSVVARYPEK